MTAFAAGGVQTGRAVLSHLLSPSPKLFPVGLGEFGSAAAVAAGSVSAITVVGRGICRALIALLAVHRVASDWS